MPRFTKKKSVHQMDCIEATDLTQYECEIVQATIMNCMMDSRDYILRTACGAFLQGFDLPKNNRKDGWVLVEFWRENQSDIDNFILYLNEKINE